jgi:CheY-like chemotaxis protein
MRDKTILLVEDDARDEALTLRALAKSNLANKVDVVRDGVEALDFLFRTGPYAERAGPDPLVVLLDLKLPKLDGIEVLKRMREDARMRLIRVVVLTTSREQRDLVESYALGASSYIVKPVDFEQFADAVRHLGLYWLVLNEPPPVR